MRSDIFQRAHSGCWLLVTNSKGRPCRSATLLFLGPKESNTINHSLMSCLVLLRRSPMALFHYILSSVWMSQNKRLMVLPGVCRTVCLWEQNGLSTPTPHGGLDVISWQHTVDAFSNNAEQFWPPMYTLTFYLFQKITTMTSLKCLGGRPACVQSSKSESCSHFIQTMTELCPHCMHIYIILYLYFLIQ